MHKAIINGKTFEIEQKQGQFTLNGQPIQMDWKPLRENVYHLILNHQSYTIELLEADAAGKTLTLLVNGRKNEVQLKDAFEIGVLIYIPFFVIDLVTSNILLAMGMMMLSPVTISMPLKLFLLVMLDGWTILIEGLVKTFI